MQDRLKYRIPFYDWNNNFIGFSELDIEKGIEPYNYGRCYHKDIEQCTGSKDKNDKLIYEGDIFKAEVISSYDGDENLYKTIYGQVSWFDIECCFSFAGYQPSDLFEIEVIGNIHKNVNLLENKE